LSKKEAENIIKKSEIEKEEIYKKAIKKMEETVKIIVKGVVGDNGVM